MGSTQEFSEPADRPGAGMTTHPPQNVAIATRGLLLGTAVAIAALWLFIRLADEVMETETQRFDSAAVSYWIHHRSVLVQHIMEAATWAGSGLPQSLTVCAVAIYFLWRRRFWPDSVTMLVGAFGGMLLMEGLKRLFHRQRPEPLFYHLGYSFPSEHSFFAVVIYGLLAYWLSQGRPRAQRIVIWVVAVLFMLLVGFSRIYLGQHYPTDVFGGYLAGSCWLWGCTLWLSWLRLRSSREQTPVV